MQNIWPAADSTIFSVGLLRPGSAVNEGVVRLAAKGAVIYDGCCHE